MFNGAYCELKSTRMMPEKTPSPRGPSHSLQTLSLSMKSFFLTQSDRSLAGSRREVTASRTVLAAGAQMGRGVRSAGFASIRYHLPRTAPALLRKLVLTAGNSPSEPKCACQRPQALAAPTSRGRNPSPITSRAGLVSVSPAPLCKLLAPSHDWDAAEGFCGLCVRPRTSASN
jgi:hypothetical protein